MMINRGFDSELQRNLKMGMGQHFSAQKNDHRFQFRGRNFTIDFFFGYPILTSTPLGNPESIREKKEGNPSEIRRRKSSS